MLFLCCEEILLHLKKLWINVVSKNDVQLFSFATFLHNYTVVVPKQNVFFYN